MSLHAQLRYHEAPDLQSPVHKVIVIRTYVAAPVGQPGAACFVESRLDFLVAPMSTTMASVEVA